MRRTCERPGCGEPVAVIYGCAVDATDTVWLDAFSPERADGPIPVGTMGVVCVVHGDRLTAPRGWTIDDRRVAVPPLFKVVTSPKTSPSAKPRAARKDRTTEVPRPSLFADLEVASNPLSESVPSVEPEKVRSDDSTELEIQQDVLHRGERPGGSGDLTGDATRPWIPTFDPDDDLNGMLDATTPMLRDAFRSRHNGRGDRSNS